MPILGIFMKKWQCYNSFMFLCILKCLGVIRLRCSDWGVHLWWSIVIMMDTPYLTHMCELWEAHFGDVCEKLIVLQQHHVVMRPDLVLVLSGCAAVIGVFTCDGVCSYDGHPMPHACVWAMGCPFWGFSVKLTAIQQHHVAMGLNLDWSYLAALVTQVFTWDGVHTFNGHPMPHSYGCAMGCTFRGLSGKINSFTAAPWCYGSWSAPAI